MAKTVYIETTIPSAHEDERDDVVSRFQRFQTRLWWSLQRSRYEVVTSEAVLAELSQAVFPARVQALKLLEGIPVIPIDDEIRGVARIYIENLVMPRGAMGDAFHLAFACVRKIDYLLTWNCRHLANPSKVTHITAINRRLGLLTPMIVTPQMLVEESADEAE